MAELKVSPLEHWDPGTVTLAGGAQNPGSCPVQTIPFLLVDLKNALICGALCAGRGISFQSY